MTSHWQKLHFKALILQLKKGGGNSILGPKPGFRERRIKFQNESTPVQRGNHRRNSFGASKHLSLRQSL
jgi:hypothetical protein